MSTTSTRLPARLPVARTVYTCETCETPILDFPHVPGIAEEIEPIIAEHLATCPGPARRPGFFARLFGARS